MILTLLRFVPVTNSNQIKVTVFYQDIVLPVLSGLVSRIAIFTSVLEIF